MLQNCPASLMGKLQLVLKIGFWAWIPLKESLQEEYWNIWKTLTEPHISRKSPAVISSSYKRILVIILLWEIIILAHPREFFPKLLCCFSLQSLRCDRFILQTLESIWTLSIRKMIFVSSQFVQSVLFKATQVCKSTAAFLTGTMTTE